MSALNGTSPPASPPPAPAAALATQRPYSEARDKFDLMQRQARVFALSPLVPAHIRTDNPEVGLANCYIALVLAEQMGENPLVVMQNIYIVHGRAGWSASYMIAKANASGVFRGVIRFKHSGEGPSRSCTATGTLRDTGEDVSATVDMVMAKAEGWTKNSKYTSMPDQMLIYRAATFLVRTYCPQVMLGYTTHEEIVDTVAAAVPDRPKLSIAEVTAEEKPAPVNRIAQIEATTANGNGAKPTGDRPDRQQFSELLSAYEAAGGDAGAWLADHKFADEGQALESSKPALSKLISQLTKDIDARKTAAAAFAIAGTDASAQAR